MSRLERLHRLHALAKASELEADPYTPECGIRARRVDRIAAAWLAQWQMEQKATRANQLNAEHQLGAG